MERQIRLRLTDADVDALQDGITRMEGRFVPWTHDTAAVGPINDLDPHGLLPGWPFIVRQDDMAMLKRYFVVDQGYWVVDRQSAPVIDWMLQRDDATGVHSARLYVDSAAMVGGIQVTKLPFGPWADSLFRWVRKGFHYERSSDAYEGPSVSGRSGR